MSRKRYSIKESLNKLLRLFQGETVSEIPEVVPGEILSEGEALSDIVELFNSSLPNQTLTLPTALYDANINSGFATGTITNVDIASGTSDLIDGVTKISFQSGLTIEITGTVAYVSVT